MERPLLGHAGWALITSLVAAACGGAATPANPPVHIPPQSAGPSSSAAAAATASPPPPGLPPMAAMPPTGVSGSKKAKKKTDASLEACSGGGASGARPTKDPAAEVKRLGDACAAASRMRALGGPIRGSQSDRDAHHEHKLRVQAGKCYRVYFAHDENVKDAVVVLRDSAGDLVFESPAAALPADGAMCFTAADELALLVGVGAGAGAYAVQVFGD